MDTLARAVDCILEAKLVEAAGLLMQRFRRLELSANEGSSSLAQHLEVAPSVLVASVTTRERKLAIQTEIMEPRLHNASARGAHRPGE